MASPILHDQSERPVRVIKVIKLPIIKPAGPVTWHELGRMLRDVRYRVYRLANLAVSERYLHYHRRRVDPTYASRPATIGALNTKLHELLQQEAATKAGTGAYEPYGTKGALPAAVVDALSQYKLRALTGAKWGEVMRGLASLPTFRLNMAIPVRCDKPGARRLTRGASGDVELDLMIRPKPYPRVIIGDRNIGAGASAVLERLLANGNNALNGYRQRVFEIKEDKVTGRWYLYVTYDFQQETQPSLDANRVVGVDVGFCCPLYAAIGHGHARLGWRAFAAIAARVRALRGRVMARRRDIQRGGAVAVSEKSARSGHGRKRKLLAIDNLQGRIDDAHTTLNHRMSAALIRFACDNGAGVVQMENLDGLKDELAGTFLGQAWRYHQLQQFVEYKAKEAGIEVRRVNPAYTSRRCSECGHIHVEFTREFRDAHAGKGKAARFECPQCKYTADADYNAARNLTALDIEDEIRLQCEQQHLALPGSLTNADEDDVSRSP